MQLLGGMDFGWNAMMLIVLLLSLTVHEWAHALAAWFLGDDTAARQGRLTLNPLPHIDPIGTLLLPFLGVPFGWAKPVPVNPLRFTREVSMSTGMMITAAAGPASNLVLALVCALLYGGLLRFEPVFLHEQPAIPFLLSRGIIVNIVLALFNLLPIPPLDGSRIMEGVVPYRHRPRWEQFTRYSPILLLCVIAFGSTLLATPIAFLYEWFEQLMWVVARRDS